MIKTFLIVAGIGLLLTACAVNKKNVQESINESAKESGFTYNVYESFDTIPNYQAVSSSLFKEIMDHPETVVIDVRTPEEIADGKILDHALEINFYEKNFEAEIQKLDKTVPYAIYCRSGNRSGKTLKIFERNGFKEAYHLYGGINAWKKYNSQSND